MIKHILRADAIFELLLAAYLIVAVIAWPEGVRMADPANHAVIVMVAGVLGAAGIGIWLFAERPDRTLTLRLAQVNAMGAVIFLGWLYLVEGFSAPAAGLIIAVSAALVALAAAESLALRKSADDGVQI